MAVDIGPKIGIDGEKEFREQINNINQQLRTMGSEMKAVVSEYDNGDRSQEALAAQTEVLTRQIAAQEEKLKLLKKGHEAAAEVTGENSKQTKKWEQSVYDATAELNRMKKQLGQADDGMEDLAGSTKKTAKQMDTLEGNMEGVSDALTRWAAGGALVAGATKVVDGVTALVEETTEYRRIMAALEVSSQSTWYTNEQTAASYKKLLGVLGDTQTAATTVANFQAIGLAQQDLDKLLTGAIGAWATYGDSIPIDGLSESINETIKAGQITGVFADVVNWATGEEDAFNAQLEKCSSASERARLVLQLLVDDGLIEAGNAYQAATQDITDAYLATERLTEAKAELAETLTPLATGLTETKAVIVEVANVAMGAWIELFTVTLPEAFAQVKTFPGAVLETWDMFTDGIVKYGTLMVEGLWKGIESASAWLKGKVRGFIDGIKSLFTGSDGFDIHSPSKWAENTFEYVMQGAANGINSGKASALAAADQTVTELQRKMRQSITTPELVANNAASGIVNGLMAGGYSGNNSNQSATIVLQLENGTEIARWLLPDIRAASKANPEVVSGV